jgi:hypothetical protein
MQDRLLSKLHMVTRPKKPTTLLFLMPRDHLKNLRLLQLRQHGWSTLSQYVNTFYYAILKTFVFLVPASYNFDLTSRETSYLVSWCNFQEARETVE